MRSTCSEKGAARRIAAAPDHYRSVITAEEPRFAVVRGARTVREDPAFGNHPLEPYAPISTVAS